MKCLDCYGWPKVKTCLRNLGRQTLKACQEVWGQTEGALLLEDYSCGACICILIFICLWILIKLDLDILLGWKPWIMYFFKDFILKSSLFHSKIESYKVFSCIPVPTCIASSMLTPPHTRLLHWLELLHHIIIVTPSVKMVYRLVSMLVHFISMWFGFFSF